MNGFEIAATGLGSIGVLLVARGPIVRWYRKVHRRRGGVYLWRVDHHTNHARRVNGYVGETVSYYFRSRQHLGHGSRYDPVTGNVSKVGEVKVPSQPWSDLRPKMYKIIPLPWWLCWKWVLRPLETLVILCTWPMYNDAKNRWNPRRVDRKQARLYRVQRDAGTATQRLRTWTAHLFRYAVQATGVLVILAGILGWAVTR